MPNQNIDTSDAGFPHNNISEEFNRQKRRERLRIEIESYLTPRQIQFLRREEKIEEAATREIAALMERIGSPK